MKSYKVKFEICGNSPKDPKWVVKMMLDALGIWQVRHAKQYETIRKRLYDEGNVTLIITAKQLYDFIISRMAEGYINQIFWSAEEYREEKHSAIDIRKDN